MSVEAIDEGRVCDYVNMTNMSEMLKCLVTFSMFLIYLRN